MHSLLLLALAWPASARLLYSGPEDLHAFPKSRVAFLNHLPVSNHTAQHWLTHGLNGGEREFMADSHAWSPKELSGSELESPPHTAVPSISRNPDALDYALEYMKMGPENHFLCLVPPPRDGAPVSEERDRNEVIRNGWSLLQPLTGKCLYVRSFSFSGSFCTRLTTFAA